VTRYWRSLSRIGAIAFRMLGSAREADDLLPEALLHWLKAGVDARLLEALLTTIVLRLCLDTLTAARARRETCSGPWLPEPIQTSQDIQCPHEICIDHLRRLGRTSAQTGG
jgi:RNA polymerase sigma-70 factor (ECF subfamily)